ncbi:MAG: thiaminase II [candidate division Zixibacteria bacterium]|nr:thiaminase II [candidate division Zixibacteria bacterium]
MEKDSFVGEIRKRSDNLWKAVLNHPFVKGIGDGSLSQDKFEYYLKQDYVYLIDFSRLLAVTTAKGRNLSDMSFFSILLNATLTMEMELHRKVCADYGITTVDLENTEPAMITTAYTKYLLSTVYEGDFRDCMAVLLPCALGYVEIAEHLRKQGLPEHKHYRAWIETYTSNEMKELVKWLEDKMEYYARNSSPEDRERWYRLYLFSARFELLFFEMGWSKSFWTTAVPAD